MVVSLPECLGAVRAAHCIHGGVFNTQKSAASGAQVPLFHAWQHPQVRTWQESKTGGTFWVPH